MVPSQSGIGTPDKIRKLQIALYRKAKASPRINFLGFSLTWRQLRQGRSYLHVEPNSKSRTAMRQALPCIPKLLVN